MLSVGPITVYYIDYVVKISEMHSIQLLFYLGMLNSRSARGVKMTARPIMRSVRPLC